MPATAWRFTIAHEIGHFLLSTDESPHIDRGFDLRLRDPVAGRGVNPEEIEADLFAAQLLMPEPLLRQDLGEPREHDWFDDRNIRELARRYEVSSQALMIRLGDLGYS